MKVFISISVISGEYAVADEKYGRSDVTIRATYYDTDIGRYPRIYDIPECGEVVAIAIKEAMKDYERKNAPVEADNDEAE